MFLSVRGGISLIYSALADPLEKATYMLNWERDPQFQWDLDKWHTNFARSFKGILNGSLVEADLKVISRWYLVPLVSPNATLSPLHIASEDVAT